jgi:hypothetical protein
MRWLLPMLALACVQDGEPVPPEPEVPVDTEVDTETPEEPLNYTVTSVQTACETPELRNAAIFDVVNSPAFDLDVTRRLEGGGLTVADFDADGRLDVFLPGSVGFQLQMQHEPMVFTEEGADRITADLSRAAAASAVDYDADGDLDLFVVRFGEPNVMLANDGDGVFTDVTASTGITGVHRSQSSSWGDMDGDGDLDLAIGNYGPRPEDAFADEDAFEVSDPSQLWENLGDGTFVDRSDLLPQRLHDAHTFMTSWLDVDNDGDQDLLYINDFGWARPSALLWNDDGVLRLDDGGAGIAADFAGMGLGVGDINGDELPDFVQSSWTEISLLVSAGGFWVESATAKGLVPRFDAPPDQLFGWGAELGDIDNDGDSDALVNFGYWDEYAPIFRQTDGVFLQDDVGLFADASIAFGLNDTAASRGLLLVDINDDGHLDVLKRRLGESTPMHVSRCSNKHWLRVRPRMADGPNPFAVGARVRFVAGDRVWSRSVHAGSTSMYSAGPPEVHVGLDDLARVDRIEVLWPNGEVSVMEDVTADQVLDITLQ